MSALVVVCGQQAAGGRLLHTHAHRHPSRLENVRARDPSTIIHAVPWCVHGCTRAGCRSAPSLQKKARVARRRRLHGLL